MEEKQHHRGRQLGQLIAGENFFSALNLSSRESEVIFGILKNFDPIFSFSEKILEVAQELVAQGERALARQILQSALELLSQWKLLPVVQVLCHSIQAKLAPMKFVELFLAQVDYELGFYQASYQRLFAFCSGHNFLQAKVQEELNSGSFNMARELYSRLKYLGLTDYKLHLIFAFDQKMSAPEILEFLILSQDKMEVFKKIERDLGRQKTSTEFLPIYQFLNNRSNERIYRNWVKAQGALATEASPLLFAPKEDYLLVEKICQETEMAIDQQNLGPDQEKKSGSYQNELESVQADLPVPFSYLLTRPYSAVAISDLENQTWDYQLASQLLGQGNYYFAMLVIEFVKTVCPLDKSSLIQVLELERTCSEHLGMLQRVQRLTSEIAGLK